MELSHVFLHKSLQTKDFFNIEKLKCSPREADHSQFNFFSFRLCQPEIKPENRNLAQSEHSELIFGYVIELEKLCRIVYFQISTTSRRRGKKIR